MGTLSWLQSFLASASDQVAVITIRLNVCLHVYLLALPAYIMHKYSVYLCEISG